MYSPSQIAENDIRTRNEDVMLALEVWATPTLAYCTGSHRLPPVGSTSGDCVL
jgi:hypothetical protein